jgi:hypothetical protein
MSRRSLWIALLMWASSIMVPTILSAQANVQMHGRGAVGSFTGIVVKVEKDALTIRDADGHAVRLRVDQQTKMEDTVKEGDTIEADLGPNGYAKAIRRIG